MNKKLCAFFLAVVFSFMCLTPAMAYDAGGHDEMLEEVLLGSGYQYPYNQKDREEAELAISLLESASYLCLDQFNGNGGDKLLFLAEQGVRGLPESITEIDFSGNWTHRSYTHRGWDWTYIVDKAHWSIRKAILQAATEKVFSFTIIPNFIEAATGSYSEQCNSFAALVYYVHVLGDHLEATSYKNNAYVMPFAGRTHDDYDLVSDLLNNHLDIVFASQTEDSEYQSFREKLGNINSRASQLVYSEGGINTQEKFDSYHAIAEELHTLLKEYLPVLLKKEPFFQKVFYPDEYKSRSFF